MASLRSAPFITACKSDSVAVSSDSISPQNQNPLLRFAVSKPSWVVRTETRKLGLILNIQVMNVIWATSSSCDSFESNVWKEKRKKHDPPCVVCRGSGRVNCHHCEGRGRTNCVNLTMLPKGEWPKWCRTCGGSGLGYCNRCLGTGEYRDVMGFRFMKIDPNSTQIHRQNQRQR